MTLSMPMEMRQVFFIIIIMHMYVPNYVFIFSHHELDLDTSKSTRGIIIPRLKYQT